MPRATSAPSSGPITITADHRMSEDYLQTADILVDPNSSNPLALVPMPSGRWTTLAVVADTGLVHVIPDQNSRSGWNLSPIPNAGAVKEVVSGLDGAKTCHAFFQDGTKAHHMSLGSDSA
jgi:hypothetical protein